MTLLEVSVKALASVRPEWQGAKEYIDKHNYLWAVKKERPIEVFRLADDGKYYSVIVIHQIVPQDDIIFLESQHSKLVFIANSIQVASVAYGNEPHDYRFEEDYTKELKLEFACLDLIEVPDASLKVLAVMNGRDKKGRLVRCIKGDEVIHGRHLYL